MSVIPEDWTDEVSIKKSRKSEQRPETDSVVSRPNVLYIRDFSLRFEPIDRSVIGFSNHKMLGSFRIDDNQRYNDTNCGQNLIKDSIDFDLISKMNINLMEGFEESALITDYKTYKILKWKYFLSWIRRSGCLENRSEESVPQFISFGGLFTSLMSTPNRFESWSLLVTKFKDSIFMNKIRLNDNISGPTDQSTNTEKSSGFVDMNPYFAAKVTQVLTKSEGKPVKDVIIECEKYFSCYETQIGSHRLLLMSEMDAIDEEGNQYEIKSTNHLNFGKKLFNWWSHCSVANIDHILIGLKDSNHFLKSVQKLTVEDIPEMPEFHWNTDQSFGFVDRFLKYVKQLLETAQDLDVYKVSFKKDQNCVRSMKLATNRLIPDWFTSGQQFDQQMDGISSTD